MKPCSCCGEIKYFNFYHNDKNSATYKCVYCKDCANRKSREFHAHRMEHDLEYREAKKSSYIKSTFGITAEEYTKKLKAQNNICAICGVKFLTNDLPHLDHCHKTNQIRDFLCVNCNLGIGNFKDSISILQNAINYLHKHNSNVA
jgi:hypothetical protein